MIRRSWITRQIIGQSPNQMTPSRALNSLYPRGVSHLFRAFTRRIEASRLPFLLSNPKEPAAHERKAGQLVTRLFRTLPVPSDRAGNPACLGWIRYQSRYPVTVTRSWLAWLIDSSGSARWFGYSVSNQQGAGNRTIPNRLSGLSRNPATKRFIQGIVSFAPIQPATDTRFPVTRA
jgi:hypothetical protein